MAERTSRRAGSRRTTPQPAPHTARVGTQSPPKRTTRTTRSQSRDISDSENGRSDSKARRGAKQATPDGTNGAVGQSGSKGRKGRIAKHARAQQDLSMVAEDPSVVYPDLETAEDGGAGENVEDAGADQQPAQQSFKSPGSLSAFSGTTARISLPAQELTEISPEDMLDTLPDLSDASDKLLSFVIPTEISETSVSRTMAQLQKKDTRENKKLQRLSDIFERQRKEYGGDSYINVGKTLRRLLGRKAGPIDEQTASWRPDALLQKANLALLVSRMLTIVGRDQNDQFLEDIAGTFPQPFAQGLGRPESLTPECSALTDGTFRVALQVRTQEAIMLLARHVEKINFDSDTALLQLFYDANNLKGWAVAGLRTEELRREFKDTILGRVEQLREAFRASVSTSSDDQSSGIESLRTKFPWTTFARQLVAWAVQRLTEIEIQTTTYGGTQAICQGLIDVVQSGRLGQSLESDGADNESDGSEVRLEYDTPSESRATSELQDTSTRHAKADELNLAQFSADSNKVKSAAAYLKQRQADRKVTKATEQISLTQNQGTASDIQVASTAGPFMRALTPQRNYNEQVIPSPAPANVPYGQAPSAGQDDNWRSEDNEEEDIAIRRNAQASDAYRTQREAESNKENVAEIPGSQHTKTAKKRSIYDRDPLADKVSPIDWPDSDPNDEQSEISADEGFQVQAESSNAAMQRRLKPATKRPASEPARLQRQSPKKVRVQEAIDPHLLDGSADFARDEQETEVPLSQAYDEYVRVNKSAKQKMAVVTKLPQRRSAWTGAETEMLYYLITEHGTSWKLLKEQDSEQGYVLEARDQVALKDKARNMKMDYLKAGRVLPQNFERIPLSQLQIKRLRDGGIEYDPETGTRVDAEVID
ncbi:hypothetical protein HO173_004867 [Letharia columbiana]|uniref:Myb-like domain-containing protein n=1 Tax=Letharia columbiana TaxID=112416 RepID=A0A8H6FY55_9LECA|nr:uncharacterized protein HO173_004867 [Letharia columbiana]KAF6236988.1 hypothetical protein HO173_004867 [Letharia columbiana]